MDEDDPTHRFYADQAATYADHWPQPSAARLSTFLQRLSPDAAILELGCGNGRDSGYMLARGYRVTPTDGIAAMAAEAERRLGVPVTVLAFEEIDVQSVYDGIWANACLLHVRRRALPGVLERVHRALTPGGIFYASYKGGADEGTDRFGRYYNNLDQAWLQEAYGHLGWQDICIERTEGGAYDGQPTEWLHVTAVKGGAPVSVGG